jgi:hypothetical protein
MDVAAYKINSDRKSLSAMVFIFLIVEILIISSMPSLLIPTVSAGSFWIQTTESDFTAGTLDNVLVTPDGNVTLALQENFIEDDFTDESKINYKKNVIVDTALGEARLLKGINETFGGPDLDWGWAVSQTSDGGYVIIGETVSYGAGFYDAWLLKIDGNGNEQWNKTFGGSAKDGGRSGQQTSDGGYIIGGYADSFGYPGHDGWLLKTDVFGNEQWNYTYGGPNTDAFFSIAQTTDGGFIGSGYETSFGAGGYDAWLVKTNAFGMMQWNKSFGAGGAEHSMSVKQASDGGYIITGYTSSYGAGGTDLWLIKTNTFGNEQWNHTFGGPNDDWGGSVFQTSDGGYIVSGDTKSYGSGGFDVWFIKTDVFGNEEWNMTYGEPFSDDTGYCIHQTSDGGYIVVVSSTSYITGFTDIWLIKTDSVGLQQWKRVFGGPDDDWGYSVDQTTDGGYVLTGYTTSYGAGSLDVWVIKTDAFGYCEDMGDLISINLLTGQGASSMDAFNCTASIPPSTSIRVQFSQDNLSWYNSVGVLNQWNKLADGFNSIDLSLLGWSGSNFYYRMNFSSDTTNNPALQNINVSYHRYISFGTLTSESFDCGGTNIKWKTLSWTAFKPPGTDIKLQLRTADTQANLSSKNFVGPDGDTGTFYTVSSGESIWAEHDGDRWVQYKVYLSDSGEYTPVLEEVTVYYNLIPDVPDLIAPLNDVWSNDSTPMFNWTFIDLDGIQQAFQVLIDNDIGFSSVDYDSGEQNSPGANWQFPTGTGYTEIADGIWYWKVRVQDNDGDWSQYSTVWIVKIDTSEPLSSVTTPVNGSYLLSLTTISGTASDGNGSGVLNVKISIKRNSDNLYWDGFAWISSETWLSTSGTTSWSISTGLPSWDSGISYTIRSMATDNVTNIEIPGSGNTFTFVAENYTILKQGWNLISIPLIQSNQDLTKVLEMIEGHYDAVQWHDLFDTNDPWKHHKIGKPFGNDLTQIDEKMGFWIHITQPGDTIFVYNGTQPSSNPTIPLHPVWNMVGYPSLTNHNRTVGLNNLTFGKEVDMIQWYDAELQEWVEIGEGDFFEIGRGYWFHATTECEWEVPL